MHIGVRGSVRDDFKGVAAQYTGGTDSVCETGSTEYGVVLDFTDRD